jgi:tetratricopeptide (TPR) repeat protein
MAVVDGDFELEVDTGSGPGEYAVRVVHAPAGGETSGTFYLDVDAILARLGELENAVLASAVTGRRIITKTEAPLHEVGQQLFRALFSGAVGGTYRASLGAAQHQGQPLRVVLRLAAPELAALPWETLFDPDTGSYLCQDRPLLRRIPAADFTPRPLELTPPLRILGVVAAPSDLPGLDVDTEKQHLETALAKPVADGLVELVWAQEATWDGIQTTLLDGPWHVLHFIGHGDYDPNRQEGRIALVTVTGRSDLVESSRLMHLLREAEPTPRLVVLNSCDSGQAGREDLFAGTAAALVRGGISAVVAMQFTVSDAAAIAFSRGFYNAIAHNRDVDAAASSGRRSIMGQNTLEWVTPVLYIRGGSTRLFTLTGKPKIPATAPAPPPVTIDGTQDQLLSLYIDARRALRSQDYASAIEHLDDLLAVAPDYRDAASLRESAIDRQERAEAYHAARDAEDRGDWATAARGYASVHDDPTYPDAAARQEACATHQRIVDLQGELRLHAAAGDWQAALDADAELASLDPSAANPAGLAVRARLELIYEKATQAQNADDWAIAADGYAEILRSDPDFRDASARRETSEARLRAVESDIRSQLQSLYSQARQAERDGDWAASADSYSEILRRDPDFRDAAAGRDRVVVQEALATGNTMFRLPALEEGVQDATITRWLKDVGERVEEDELLLEVSTDKVDTEIPSTVAGTVLKILVDEDETVEIGAALAVIETQQPNNPGGSRELIQLRAPEHAPSMSNSASVPGTEVLQVRHDNLVRAVAFSPDGTRLATGSADKTARIWDTTTGSEVLTIKVKGFLNAVYAVAFHPDGTRLATGNWDETVRIWDTTTGTLLPTIKVKSFLNAVYAVAFHPDGTRLATGSADKTARLWDAATGREQLQVRHDEWVNAVGFSPDGTRLATASEDTTARIWDAFTGKELLQVRHDKDVRGVAFSPDGTRLATASKDNTARIWRV